MARIKNFLTPQWLKEFEEMTRQAASRKPQATKSQAASDKPQATETQAASGKHQARRRKPRASSRKPQAPR